ARGFAGTRDPGVVRLTRLLAFSSTCSARGSRSRRAPWRSMTICSTTFGSAKLRPAIKPRVPMPPNDGWAVGLTHPISHHYQIRRIREACMRTLLGFSLLVLALAAHNAVYAQDPPHPPQPSSPPQQIVHFRNAAGQEFWFEEAPSNATGDQCQVLPA